MRRYLVAGLAVVLALLLASLYGLVHLMAVTGETRPQPIVIGVYEYTPDFAATARFLLFVIPITGVVWWVLRAPDKLAAMRRGRQRDRGVAALEDAMIAAAGGDGRTARREARRAAVLLQRPAAPRLVAAQSLETAGDVVAAEAQYAAMLADSKTELVGRRGLAAAALSRKDYETAIVHATAAFAAHPTARWAFDLLFDAQVAASKWSEALVTLTDGAKRGHVPDDSARRRRAVLFTAQATRVEALDPYQARDLAEQAANLSPAFAPAVALAARLAVLAGKGWRAASLIEDAWTVTPHPALALAYRDIKPEETPRARAERLRGLAQLNADHRESRILVAESALTFGMPTDARDAIAPLMREEKEATARLCGLLAQIADAEGRTKEAREWVACAAIAPAEPDWSDLDPEGPAFAYTDEDWARLIYSFGDTGALIHPRHERFEPARAVAPQALLEDAAAADARTGIAQHEQDKAARNAESAQDTGSTSEVEADANEPDDAPGPAASPFRPFRGPPDDPGTD